MMGTSQRASAESGRKAYEESNRRRIWGEQVNAEFVRLTGEPFVDTNPASTQSAYDLGYSAVETVRKIVDTRKIPLR